MQRGVHAWGEGGVRLGGSHAAAGEAAHAPGAPRCPALPSGAADRPRAAHEVQESKNCGLHAKAVSLEGSDERPLVDRSPGEAGWGWPGWRVCGRPATPTGPIHRYFHCSEAGSAAAKACRRMKSCNQRNPPGPLVRWHTAPLGASTRASPPDHGPWDPPDAERAPRSPSPLAKRNLRPPQPCAGSKGAVISFHHVLIGKVHNCPLRAREDPLCLLRSVRTHSMMSHSTTLRPCRQSSSLWIALLNALYG